MNASITVLALLLGPTLLAQDSTAQNSLQGLVDRHDELIKASWRSDDPDAPEKAIRSFASALRGFLENEARGEEVHETRFYLVSTLMGTNDIDEARKTLREFVPAKASILSCATAALLAGDIGMDEERNAWVDAATKKGGSFDDRMELGIMLMSALNEPERGEALFTDALDSAPDAEAKAQVLWHKARATREREDLPEGAYEEALSDLATELPNTRFGRIAGDRLKAMDFRVGGETLPLTLENLDGKTFDLAAQSGKVVLLYFWASDEASSEQATSASQRLHQEFADDGLVVQGISLDETKSRAMNAIETWQTTFPQAWVTNGMNADLALRYRVEGVPNLLLVGRDGKFAGLYFVVTDEYGRSQLSDAVKAALAK